MAKKSKHPSKKTTGVKAVKAWEIKPLTWKPVEGFPDETEADPNNPFDKPDDENFRVGTSKHTCSECGRVDWSWGLGGEATNRGFTSQEYAQAAAEAWWRLRVATLISPLPSQKGSRK